MSKNAGITRASRRLAGSPAPVIVVVPLPIVEIDSNDVARCSM
jgi:hypothetical protein